MKAFNKIVLLLVNAKHKKLSVLAVLILLFVDVTIGKDQTSTQNNVGGANEQWVRPVVLADPSKPLIIAVADGKVVEYPVKDKKPGIKYYCLVHGMLLPTVAKANGNMIYDQDTLPFNKPDGALFSNSTERTLYSDSMSMSVAFVYEKVTFRYSDSIVSSRKEFETYKDSIAGRANRFYIAISKNKEVVPPFYLIFNDTVSIRSSDLIELLADSEREQWFCIDSVLRSALGLDSIQAASTDSVPVSRMMLAFQRHVPSFINQARVTSREVVDDAAIPPVGIREGINWKHIGAIALKILVGLLAIFGLFEIIAWAIVTIWSRKKDDPEEISVSDLKKQLKNANKEIGQLETEKRDLQKTIDLWKELTRFDAPEQALSKMQELQNKVDKLEIENSDLESQNTRLNGIVDRVKDNPQSLKGEDGFVELSRIIDQADMVDQQKHELENNPSLFDGSTPTGIMVAKGELLDRIKENALLIKEVESLDGSDLQKAVGYLDAPEDILEYDKKELGLYRLINSVNSLVKEKNQNINLDEMSYDWLKEKLKEVVKDRNELVVVKATANVYGTDLFDTQGLDDDIKRVFCDANRYLNMANYKNYWKHIVSPLFDVLYNLHEHDKEYNMRSLLFYSSQLYSIACIMNELHDNKIYSQAEAIANVEPFNGMSAPRLSSLGIPEYDQSILQKYMYQWVGADGETDRINYLKPYKPLPFIFINWYVDDSKLS